MHLILCSSFNQCLICTFSVLIFILNIYYVRLAFLCFVYFWFGLSHFLLLHFFCFLCPSSCLHGKSNPLLILFIPYCLLFIVKLLSIRIFWLLTFNIYRWWFLFHFFLILFRRLSLDFLCVLFNFWLDSLWFHFYLGLDTYWFCRHWRFFLVYYLWLNFRLFQMEFPCYLLSFKVFLILHRIRFHCFFSPENLVLVSFKIFNLLSFITNHSIYFSFKPLLRFIILISHLLLDNVWDWN